MDVLVYVNAQHVWNYLLNQYNPRVHILHPNTPQLDQHSSVWPPSTPSEAHNTFRFVTVKYVISAAVKVKMPNLPRHFINDLQITAEQQK